MKLGSRMGRFFINLAILVLVVVVSGCSTTGSFDPRAGLATQQGVGLDSSEFVAITDQVVADLSNLEQLKSLSSKPRLFFDPSLFRNDSPQAVDKEVIVGRIRAGLLKSANTDIVFVQQSASYDFVLTGKFKARSTVNPALGLYVRFNQLTFELYDLSMEQSLIWTNVYESEKSSVEDAIYR